MTSDESITVVPFTADKEAEWSSFLAASANGTLFHDIDFLAYHPPGRFEFHHLLFYRKGVLIALLPAGIASSGGWQVLESPAGASIGGFVLAPGLSALVLIDLCRSVQEYVQSKGWGGIEMRIPPAIYQQVPTDALGFALAATRFSLVRRALTICVPFS